MVSDRSGSMTAVEGLGPVAAVAAYGLPSTRTSFPTTALLAGEWRALLDATRTHRLTGLLVGAIRGDALPATEEQLRQATWAHREAMSLVLRLEQLLLHVAGRLHAAGIDHRVLKGPAVAHTLYPDPALRSFIDIDLLVPSASFDDALAVVVDEGGVRQFPEPRPGFDRRFSKGTSLLMPEGLEIDLHRTFVAGPFGLSVKLDDLFANRLPFTVAGVTLHGLDPEARFLHLCYHAALGDATPRLVPLRDVAQTLLMSDLDEPRVRELCRRWGAQPVMARAINATWSVLDIADAVPLSSWAAAYRPDRAGQRALRAYAQPGNSYPAQALGALRAIPGVTAKAAYLRAMALPDRSYVDGRYHNRLERWQHAWWAVQRYLKRG